MLNKGDISGYLCEYVHHLKYSYEMKYYYLVLPLPEKNVPTNRYSHFKGLSVAVELLNFSCLLPLLRSVFALGKRFRFSAAI